MNTTVTTLEIIAGRLKNFTPSGHKPIEFFAYIFETALQRQYPATDSEWIEAIQSALKSMPRDAVAAVKASASRILGDESILGFQLRRDAAQAKIEEAQAEAEAVQREEQYEQTKREFAEIAAREAAFYQNAWGRDFASEIEAAKKTILRTFGKERASNEENSKMAAAFERIGRLRTLMELAPEALKSRS